MPNYHKNDEDNLNITHTDSMPNIHLPASIKTAPPPLPFTKTDDATDPTEILAITINDPDVNQGHIIGSDNKALHQAEKIWADTESRLHPKSWFLLFINNLLSIVIAIVIISINIGIGSGGDMSDLVTEIDSVFSNLSVVAFIPLIFFGFFVFGALKNTIHLLTFRFHITQSEMRVRWGMLNKQKRHIPLHKIHNVGIHQTLLHRLFDVAIVTLESAGSGQESEIVFNVLSHSDAMLLEQALMNDISPVAVKQDAQAESSNVTESNSPTMHSAKQHSSNNVTQTLLTLNNSELIKYGLISNTGIAFGGFLTVIISPDGIAAWIMSTFGINIPKDSEFGGLVYLNEYLFGGQSAFIQGVMWFVITITMVASVIVAGKIISIISAFLNLHDFKLTTNIKANESLLTKSLTTSGIKEDVYVAIEKGLLTRKKSRVPLAKIQVWQVHESIFHRLFHRQTLKLDTAILSSDGHGRNNIERGISELIPLTTPEHMQALLSHWGQPNIKKCEYYPVHHKAWRRLSFPWIVMIFLMAGVSILLFSMYATFIVVVAVLALIFAIIVNAKRAENMGVVLTDSHLIWRDGWLNRVYCITELTHTHGIAITSSPFDRRYGMTTLIVDTVGGKLLKARLTMPYLDSHIAKKIVKSLREVCK